MAVNVFATDRHVVILADQEAADRNGVPMIPGHVALMCSEAIGFDPDIRVLLDAHLTECGEARCRYVVPRSLQPAFAEWASAHPDLDIVLWERVGGGEPVH